MIRALFVAVALLAAWFASDLLLLVFGAILLAILLTTLTDWLVVRTQGPRVIALALVILVLITAAVSLIWLLAPRVAQQIQELAKQVPAALERLRNTNWFPQALEKAQGWINAATVARIGGVFTNTVGVFAYFFILIIIAVYLAAQPSVYKRGFLSLFPKERQPRLCEVLDEIARTLRYWFLGQLVMMSAVAILTGTGLALIGVPLAFTLGILAGLLDFIPNFGPLIAAIPAILLAFAHQPIDALWVGLLYLAVQNIENQVLGPLIQTRAVELPPALIVVSQILFGVFFGALGLILATPITAAARIAVKRLYIDEQQ